MESFCESPTSCPDIELNLQFLTRRLHSKYPKAHWKVVLAGQQPMAKQNIAASILPMLCGGYTGATCVMLNPTCLLGRMGLKAKILD